MIRPCIVMFMALMVNVRKTIEIFGNNTLPPQVRSIRAFGSAGINLAYLAMGAVDCYFEFGFHIWDYAGPCLLVRCLEQNDDDNDASFWDYPGSGTILDLEPFQI